MLQQHEEVLQNENDLLLTAAFTGRVGLVEKLLKSGIKADSRGNLIHDTPLMVAAWNIYLENKYENYLKIIDMLIANGADVNAVDKDGCTALMRNAGTTSGYRENVTEVSSELMQKLIDVGADVNAVDKNGMTALMHAMPNSDYTTKKDIQKAQILLNVQTLLKAGADMYIKDKEGKNAMDYALEYFHSFKDFKIPKLLAATAFTKNQPQTECENFIENKAADNAFAGCYNCANYKPVAAKTNDGATATL